MKKKFVVAENVLVLFHQLFARKVVVALQLKLFFGMVGSRMDWKKWPIETVATVKGPIAARVARFEEDLLTLKRITRKLGLLRAFSAF